MRKLALILWYCVGLASYQFAVAQSTTIEVNGTIIESVKKNPLPFTHIIINDGEQHFFSNIDGNFKFTIEPQKVRSITFKQPLYRSFRVVKHLDSLLKVNPFFEVILHPTELHLSNESSINNAKPIIEKVLENLNHNNPDILNTYTCTGYNKIMLTSKEKEATQSIFDFIYKYLFKIKQQTNLGDHHIFLLETISEKQFIDKYHQKELITASKISGLDDPSLLLAGINAEHFTIYDKFIKIAGSQYINPINRHTFRRYHFETVDTIPQLSTLDTIFVVKFTQRENKNFQGLKGFLYINSSNYAVQYFVGSPMLSSSFDRAIYQTYGKLSNDKWFPLQTNSYLSIGKLGASNAELFLYSKKTNTNIQINQSLGKQYFNEYIVEQHSGYNIDNEDYWKINRMDYLSQKDINTYILYDSINKKQYLDRFINIGHKLYFGQLPLNKFNIDLNRIFSFNDYENFRTGFGFHTNEKLFKKLITGVYFGYGTRDEKFKYGGDVSFILNKELDCKLNLIYYKDLAESGATNFAFNEYLYSTERLRKYRVLIKDWEKRSEINLKIHPIKYLNLQWGITQSNKVSTYNYGYNQNNQQEFNFFESSIGIRYAYREQFIKTETIKLSRGSTYPILYFTITRGLNTHNNLGNFDYHKFDLRIDKVFNTLNFGHSTLQLKLGYIDNENIPYMNLYNISGSNNNDITFLAHNSFMTMGYNEFTASKYINIFYTHNFGRFYARDRFFNPEIEIIANMGWGKLKKPNLHQYIILKSIEKGFYESGLNMNNILNLNLTGLKIGFGVGFFYRMGAYAFKQNNQNLISKITTNFYF